MWRVIEKPESLVSQALKRDFFLKPVPRAGVEPARVAPLVFETSASTDSAIWAFAGAKIHVFSEMHKLLAEKEPNSFYLTIFKE